MSGLLMRAIGAGVFFGLWPLVMNRSGLKGGVASLIFTLTMLVMIAPVALSSGIPTMSKQSLLFAVAAGVLGALGTLCMNGMVSRASVEQVSMLFLIMIMVQVAAPVIYQGVVTGGYMVRQLAGIVLAIIAVYLLVEK